MPPNNPDTNKPADDKLDFIVSDHTSHWYNRRPVQIAALVLLAAALLIVWLLIRSDEQGKKAPPAAKLTTAEVQNMNNDFDAEAASLRAYLDTKPPKAEADKATVKLAAAYLNDKEYDKAIATFKTLEADTKSPMRQSVLKGLADTYAVKGDKANAISYYEKLVAFIDSQSDPEGQSRSRQRAYAEKQIEKLRSE